MTEVAFGRRVPILPRIEPKADDPLSRAEVVAPKPTHMVHTHATSNLARQIIQRKIEKMEEMLAAQAEREKAEGGVVRILIAAARERLASVIRRRAAFEESSRKLIQDNEALFAASVERSALNGERTTRTILSAAEFHRRGLAEAQRLSAENSEEAAHQQSILAALRAEAAALQAESTRLRAEVESLRAQGSTDSLQQHVMLLRGKVAAAKETHRQALEGLEEQVARVHQNSSSLQRRRQTLHGAQLATTVMAAMSPVVKAWAVENVRLRKELDMQHMATGDLQDSVACLEETNRGLCAQLDKAMREQAERVPEIKGLPSRRLCTQAMLDSIRELSESIHA